MRRLDGSPLTPGGMFKPERLEHATLLLDKAIKEMAFVRGVLQK